jgi:hypothetical protein
MCAAIVLAGLAAGCELVAGIQDKYLIAPDASGVGVSPSETSLPTGDDSTDGSVARSEASDAATPDATDPPEAIDAPMTTDALLDASTPALLDAADAGDPSRTAPDAGTTDPSAPCSGQPAFLFCDDFDTETLIGQGWTWVLSSIDGGSEAFDTAAYTSYPRSALIVAPATAPPNNELFGLDVGSLTSQVRVAFDLRIDMDNLSSLPETAIAQVLGGSTIELDYLVRPNQGALLNALLTRDAGGVSITLPAPPLRTWTRLVIVYDESAGVTVYEDGVQIGASAAAASGPPNDTKVQLGMVYQLGAGSATLQTEMDNIVVRGQ